MSTASDVAPDFGPRFQVRREVGRGSTGVVYEALDSELDRPVALKALRGVDATTLAAVKREFRLLRLAEHPNVVGFHELFFEDGRAFFTMDLIDGRPYVDAVRDAVAARDEPRTRALVQQVTNALRAIHAVGTLHRDIKPGNLLVDATDRPVVLDLGLAEHGHNLAGGRELAGTPAYLAPEALFGDTSPASDWFGFGAVLAEAVLGELPWARGSLQGRPPPEHELRASFGAGVWPWLVDRIVALLARDPARRLETADLDQRSAPRGVFVGRNSELDRLERALQRVLGGEPVLVEVSGQAGIGKTTLINAFVERARSEHGAVVLTGSCHHTEHVPYRALDPILEELTIALRRQAGEGDTGAAELLELWGRVGRGAAGGTRTTHATGSLVPGEQRRAHIRALQRIWTTLRTAATVVVVLEDIQWGDGDSAELLAELLAGRGPFLLILVKRLGEARGPFEERWAEVQWDGTREAITLDPLDGDAAEALVRSVRPDVDTDRLCAITAAAAGVPFLLDGLTRTPDPETSDLRSMSRRRLAALDSGATAVLQLLLLQPEPLPTAVILEASPLGPGARVALRELERAALVRTEGTVGEVALYHELLRAPLAAETCAANEVATHGRLADAFEALVPGRYEARVHHLLGAGRPADAAATCRAAAEKARERVEFLREAAWLERAAAIRGNSDAATQEQIGLAYYNAGHHQHAGEAYRRASDAARAEGASVRHIERLQLSAADALTAAGQVDAGAELYAELMADKRLVFNRGRVRGIAEGTWHRLRTTLTPFAEPRPECVHDAWEMELLRSVSQRLTMSRMHIAFAMSGLHFARAMRGGTAEDQVHAISTEATFQAGLGGWWAKRSEKLMQRLAWLLETYDLPAQHTIEQTRGPWHWFLGRWAACAKDCGFASRRIRTEMPGQAILLAIVDSFGNSARCFMGDFGSLEQDIDEALDAALARGDRFAHLLLDAGDVGIRYFVRDDLAGAEALVERLPEYLPADAGVMEYSAATHVARTHLYAGRVGAAAQQLGDAVPRLRRNQSIAMQVPRAIVAELQGRSLARLALEGDRPAMHALGRCIRTLKKIDLPFAGAMTLKLSGALEYAKRRDNVAGTLYAEAATRFHRADMRLQAWAAQRGAGREAPCPVTAGDPARLLAMLDPVVAAVAGHRVQG